MNQSKIAKLCNEIEDIACDISQQTMNDIVSSESRMIFDKAKEIAAEISAPPKTNADRIRQMADEELANFINDVTDCCSDGYICEKCPLNSVGKQCNIVTFEKWLKQECEENDET